MANWRRRSKRDIVYDTLIEIFMILFLIVTLYPILNTLAISFNDGIDSVRGGVYLWPRMFTLQNYKSVFNNQNLTQAAFISVSRTVSFPTATDSTTTRKFLPPLRKPSSGKTH